MMISENISQNFSQELSDDNISFFIEEMLGDSHLSFEYIFFLSIIYSIFLIVGVPGNLSTCMVIISNEYMRTATNVYPLNLAIADTATLVISKYIGFPNLFSFSFLKYDLDFKTDYHSFIQCLFSIILY